MHYVSLAALIMFSGTVLNAFPGLAQQVQMQNQAPVPVISAPVLQNQVLFNAYPGDEAVTVVVTRTVIKGKIGVSVSTEDSSAEYTLFLPNTSEVQVLDTDGKVVATYNTRTGELVRLHNGIRETKLIPSVLPSLAVPARKKVTGVVF